MTKEIRMTNYLFTGPRIFVPAETRNPIPRHSRTKNPQPNPSCIGRRCPRYVLSPWICVVTLSLLSVGARVEAASNLKPFMPRAEDFTLLWWANGPQHYLGMKEAPPAPVLCLQSGVIGLA